MFYGEDIINSKKIKLRFIWKQKQQQTAYWQQAYFIEAENKWDFNWIMEFQRSVN